MTPASRLAALGITLSPPSAPVGSFVPWTQSGDVLFLSGHIARQHGHPWVGQLGATLSTETGRLAARAAAIDLLGTLQDAAGDIDRIDQIVRLTVMVSSTPAFTEQHVVANGASDLLADIFGARGRHARSAFGVVQIPFGACVELEMIARIRQ